MSKLILISVLLIGTVSLVDSADQVVPVSIYYESLCPDSIKFITTQVYPTYTSPLRKYFQLKLVPYGKSKHRGTPQNWEFECHHGPVECYGNKVHSCIIKKSHSESDQLRFIDCLLSLAQVHREPYPVEQCASSNSLDANPIVHCANGTVGGDLLAANGDLTGQLSPALQSVPTVVFNENYSKKDQDSALVNFKAVLCSYIKGERPYECQGANSVSGISVSFVTFVTLIFWNVL